MSPKDLRELLKLLATPGDIAAASIGFAIGFPVDFFLFHMGVPSLTVSTSCATALFGAKKAIEAGLASQDSSELSDSKTTDEFERQKARAALGKSADELTGSLRLRNSPLLSQWILCKNLWNDGNLSDVNLVKERDLIVKKFLLESRRTIQEIGDGEER